MFTLDQINKIHDRFGSSKTLAEYLHASKGIGVSTYDSFISDGHSEYYDEHGSKVVSLAVHETFAIADESNEENFLQV